MFSIVSIQHARLYKLPNIFKGEARRVKGNGALCMRELLKRLKTMDSHTREEDETSM